MSKEERLARAAARRAHAEGVPIRRFRLGEEPLIDLRAFTSVDDRLREIARLSHQAFSLSGQAWPSYGRADMPGKVIRR